jgi:hypothetical protein
LISAASRTGPPNFIGVGTQRSGTTWWFRTLLGHPQIRAPLPGRKELHFFDRYCAEEMGDADVARYHELFPRASGQLVGEWTPRYMHDFWTPPLLRRAAPEARLLVLLRDPIERFRSGVPHRRTRSEEILEAPITADAIERGRYASQLSRLHAGHPAAEVLVLQYERCVADPAGQYRRTLEFLGADAAHEPEQVERPRGTSQASHKTPLWPDLLAGLQAAFEPEVAELARMTPDIDVSLWPNFKHLAP